MTQSDAAPSLGSLTEKMKTRTWALHVQAERSGIINDILRKKSDRISYALLLRNLLPAYRTMETAFAAHHGRAIYRPFAAPALARSARIESDLVALNGDQWSDELPLLPEAVGYAKAVARSAEGDGVGLVAHAYVRYFGDLSGGQVIKRILSESLGIPAHALTFYDFPGIRDVDDVKHEMRQVIDSDTALNNDQETVILEAMRAFEHNIAISKAIQAWAARAA
jgi:heme oxygenase